MNRNRKRHAFACAFVVTSLVALPALGQVKDYRKIDYPPLPDFKIEKPVVYTLDNGLTIFLLEDHELPLISISGRIRTGSNYEPADKTGLADLVGQVMREGGTTSRSGDEIDEFLEGKAAFVETGMSGDFGSASMNCLAEDFDDVLPVFVDVLRNPVFAQDKLDLAKQQEKTAISRRNDDIAGIAGREFSRLLYGYDSPLARMVEYATLASVTRDDLLAWHARYYHPNNMMLGIVGDFDAGEMKRKIESAFAGWSAGPAADLPEVPVREASPGLYFIEKSDVTQAYVRIGHRGIRTDNPDYYAVEVMNEIFGGGFSARLFSNVRSEKGLAYSVRGSVGDSFIREGLFVVSTSTKSETMAAAIDALKIEIDAILEAPPTDEEMKRAKEAILNSFVFNYTSKAQILAQQLTYAYFGYPADFLDRFQQGIRAVTKEDVARVAKKYIHPDKLVTLVVGNSADFDRPVSSFGQAQTVDIEIPAPESAAPAIERTAETLARGGEILRRAAAALNPGGKGLFSLETALTVAIEMGGQSISLGQDVTIVLPDKIRQTLKTPMGEQTVIVNGDAGVRMGGGQKAPMSAEQATDQVQSLQRNLLVLVSRAGEVEAVAGGSETVDGTECDRIAVALDGSESTLCVAADGRVLRQTYQGRHPLQGTPGELAVTYADYRETDGRLVPFRQLMHFDGQVVATVTMDGISFNGDIDPAAFEIE